LALLLEQTEWRNIVSSRKHLVEEALGVKVPEQYAVFLEQYGIYQRFGCEVYGVSDILTGYDGIPCVIGATELYRKHEGLPHRFLVIHETGDEDETICLDTEDGTVHSISRWYGNKKVADSFDEWFQKDIVEFYDEMDRRYPQQEWDEHGKLISVRGKMVEKALGVEIPNDYALFLNVRGIYAAGPVEIFGLDDDIEDVNEFPCVIGATRYHREHDNLPHLYLVLDDSEADGHMVCLDTEDGGIYVISPEIGTQKLSDSFESWFGDVCRWVNQEGFDEE
jgi:hypothetical protein